jgi:hypothetical protein
MAECLECDFSWSESTWCAIIGDREFLRCPILAVGVSYVV